MKQFLFALVLLLSANVIFAQSETKYETENEGWLVMLDDAYAESQKTGKPILANFTGSDWCGWCKRLSAAVFVKPEFKKWAQDNVVLLELDFPRRKAIPEEIKQQNAGLQRAFKVRGFPTVWVFNLDKDPATQKYSIQALGKTGYTKTVGQFTSDIERMIDRGNAGE